MEQRFGQKDRDLGAQQKAVIKLQYLVEWYMAREARFKAVSQSEIEDLVEDQRVSKAVGQKKLDAKLKDGLMSKMEQQQRAYSTFVDGVRKQTHMLKKKEDEVKRLRDGLIEKVS